MHTGIAGLAQLVGAQPSWDVPAVRGSVMLRGHGTPSFSCSMLALCMTQGSIDQPQEPPVLQDMGDEEAQPARAAPSYS